MPLELRAPRRTPCRVARRAYRRPVTGQEVETLLRFYRDGRREGSFDAGIQLAIEYDPEPPFDSGSPSKAPADVVEMIRAFSAQAEAAAGE